MADFTDAAENAVGGALFDNTDFTGVANLHVAAHTADPTNSGEANEVGAGDYDRVATSPGDWSTSGNAPLQATNDVDVEFDEATSNWGTITHISVWDGASDTDTAYTVYELDESVTIDDGDILRFPTGDITFDIN